MVDAALNGCRVLIVEDEYVLAFELHGKLTGMGATVLGPVGTLVDALDLINSESRIDVAVLDVNLRGHSVFPAAELLISRGTPILFTTGYDTSQFPSRFQSMPRCEKPIDLAAVTHAICELVGK
ncbi:MAG TPA: hypothetical protein VFS47_01470 [Steroidobacteraceae bacterium]|nr:hypothetical protein [Steroidobacteraceae bacterium]